MAGSAEESGDEQGVYRQAGTAAHERAGQDRDQTVFFIVQCTSGHDARYVAAKAEDHRNEGLAVQPQGTHSAVDEEGGTGHITRIFEKADE